MAAENLTPAEAKTTIESLGNFAAALRGRTEGVTWMIWALAGTGISLTYALLSVLMTSGLYAVPWYAFAIAWAPWVVGGYTVTGALWNSVAIALNVNRKHDFARYIVAGVIWVAAILVLNFVMRRGVFMLPSATFMLGIFGVASLFFGGIVSSNEERGKRYAIGLGGSLLAAALVAYILNVDGWAGMMAASALAAISYFALGAVLAFRR
jgi:hypothetical protein